MIKNLDNSLPETPSVPLLPRSGWNSQREYLRILLKVKKALDKIEQGS
jgi:hypothetical protein